LRVAKASIRHQFVPAPVVRAPLGAGRSQVSNPVSPIRRKCGSAEVEVPDLQVFSCDRRSLTGASGSIWGPIVLHQFARPWCSRCPLPRLLLPALSRAHPDGALATEIQRGRQVGDLCRMTHPCRNSIRTGLPGRARARGALGTATTGSSPVDDREPERAGCSLLACGRHRPPSGFARERSVWQHRLF